MILSLARIQLPTRDGQLMPIVYMEDVKPLIEELVGLPLGEAMRQANQMQPQGQTPIAKVNNNIQPLNFNENVEGFDMMNNPLTGGGVVGA
jgi:hypothetical protein